jgi:membrane fusion protein (multidrug efflux system)
MEQRFAHRKLTVLLVGVDPLAIPSPRPLALGALDLLFGQDLEQARQILQQQEIGVLVVGARLPIAQTCELLTQTVESSSPSDLVRVVFTSSHDLPLLEEGLEAYCLFYLSPEPTSPDQLSAILLAAAKHYGAKSSEEQGPASLTGNSIAPQRLQQIVSLTQGINSQRDPSIALHLALQAVEELVEVRRAYAWLYDESSDTLCAKAVMDDEERRERAALGLLGYVLRTGESLRLEWVGADPRYRPRGDDPLGQGSERWLAIPLKGLEGQVMGVLVGVRSAAQPAFSSEDQALLEGFAAQCGPPMGFMVRQRALEQRQLRELLGRRGQAHDLFREEALSHNRFEAADQGHPLQLSSGWIRATYGLLLAIVAAALLFVLTQKVYEYGEGPSLIRIRGKTAVTAPAPGTISSIEVQPGQRVMQGDVLLRFDNGQNNIKPSHLPLENNVVKTLRAEPILRAAHAGVVEVIRVRPGQQVRPGDLLLSLTGNQAHYSLVAILPGDLRPQLKPAMDLRLHLTGYAQSFVELKIASFGDEVVGAQEAKRYLGPELGENIIPEGPVVLVQATLPTSTFTASGHRYRYYDGMSGRVLVRLRKENILLRLVPGLKALFEKNTDGS